MSLEISPQRWQRINTLLDQVLDQPESEQLDFLKMRCGDDDELYREVAALVKAAKQAPEFLDGVAMDLASGLGSEIEIPVQNFTRLKIGPYELREEIGRGGMGVVYRAERIKGDFNQQVAIKLLWDKSGETILLERFHREQQLLAALDHPNIARLYDGGLTEQGLAYFVMEYISGEAIDEYCNTNKLSIEDRLKLIAQVADTLAFAHKNLIVHCDIKPSNILVDREGKVKLLDFGIARIVNQQASRDLTLTGDHRMTPGYAAPEQLQNKNITVATDIYQLGLVAYELLTGVRAYARQTGSFVQLVQAICQQEPDLPSRAAGRAENNIAPTKKLRGDLDAILLKMLNVSPEKRYSSMEAFKNDYHAWLENRPVSAHYPGIFYQANKFARRHWRLLSAVATFSVLVIAYAITVTWQAEKIERALTQSQLERDKAQRVSDFLVDIFKAADPNVAGLESVTARELLEKGHEKILLELDAVPEIQTHILTLLGEIYVSQGAYHSSQQVLEASLARYREGHLQNASGLANTLAHLAFVYMYTGRYDDAENRFNEALLIYRQIPVSEQVRTTQQYAQTLAAYGHLQRLKGNHTVALDYVNQAIHWSRSINNGYSEEYATALNNLVSIQHIMGRFDEARKNIATAIEVQKAVTGETHSFYSVALTNAAIVLTDMEYFGEAEELANEALRLQLQLLGENHLYVANTFRTLGILRYFNGDLEGAESHLQKDLLIREKLRQRNLMTSASSLLWLGIVLQDAGKFDAAEKAYDEMINVFRSLTDNGAVIGRGISHQASLAYASGDFRHASEQYADALAIMPKDARHTADAFTGYALTLLALNELPEALENIETALAIHRNYFPETHLKVNSAKALAGIILHRLGRHEHAYDYLHKAVSELEPHQWRLHHR